MDTDDSQDNRGREGIILLPVFHFHPLTNIETFQVFACEITSYFYSQRI